MNTGGHTAALIAGPMLRAVDAQGRKQTPATVDQVRKALFGKVSNCVVAEWLNIARRRNGLPSEETLRGDDYRAIAKARASKHVRVPTVARASIARKVLRGLQRLARKITRRHAP